MKIEHLILKNIVYNEDFCRSSIPFLKEEYFHEYIDKTLFKLINTFVNTYKSRPSIEAIKLMASESKKLKYEDIDQINSILDSFNETDQTATSFLLKETEQFCKEKALHNAVLESIKIISDENEKRDKGVIPELLKDALSISFDPSVGHDFILGAEDRFDFYHRKEERIPFDIQQLNYITNGGLPNKSLTIIVAGVNVGKSLAMCHMAAANLLANKNVLYITCEMAEERIAERIDANVLDITLDTLRSISKNQFMKLINQVQQRTSGKLVIKEYPTSSANASHFRYLLHELALKKNFVPDIIYIDYLNICTSSRMKNNGAINSYTLVKAIAEELRGLAVEMNLPIVTATQFTRSGATNSDADMTDVSESFGTVATADLVLALINTEELEKLGQLMIKQLKNRFNDVTKNKKFLVGVDRSKMRLFDIGNVTIDGEGGIQDNYNHYDKEEYDDPPMSKSDKFSKFKF